MVGSYPSPATGPEWIDLELDRPGEIGFFWARLLPGRALMLLQARARLAGGAVAELLFTPGPNEVAAMLGDGPQDFMGNASFAFGGALLAPYANRIRGTYSAAGR